MATDRDRERILRTLRGADAQYRAAKRDRKRLVREAVGMGVKQIRIAQELGLSPGRISQILREAD